MLDNNVGVPTKNDGRSTISIHRRYCSHLGSVAIGEGFATPTTSSGTYELASNWVGPINPTEPTGVDHLYSVERKVRFVVHAVICVFCLMLSPGPINYFNVLGRDYIVLNTSKAVNDLLVQRGANYSDRPKLEMVGPL